MELSKAVGASNRDKGFFHGNGYIVSWCVGHLLELAKPESYNEKYKHWDLESLPIVPQSYHYEVSSSTKDQYAILTKLMKRSDVDSLICATDAGREGELIFRLVYEQSGCTKPFERLWVSSMEQAALKEGLSKMQDGHNYDNLSEAAKCRQWSDWLYGMNLSRLYCVKHSTKLNTGRIQTPTLSMIVNRQEKIDNFQPEKSYRITAAFEGFQAVYKCDSYEEAQRVHDKCKDSTGFVVKAEEREAKMSPPRLYDLTTLQRDANRLLGYPAKQTLDIVQVLYEDKLCTYPRTDSQYLPESMEATAEALAGHLLDFSVISQKEQPVNVGRLLNDAKISDHHAIIPTMSLTAEAFNERSSGDKAILLLILFRFLMAIHEPKKTAVQEIEIDIQGTVFTSKANTTVDSGYTSLEEDLKTLLGIAAREKDTQLHADVSEGDVLPITGADVKEVYSQPPKAFTEDTLLSAMETCGREIEDEALRERLKNKGLGTPATRAAIIESIVKNGYVKREKKHLIPTEKGITFMQVVTPELKDARMTARWEELLYLVEKGSYSPDEFMKQILDSLTKVIQQEKRSTKPDAVFQDSFGICPKCGMPIFENSKGYCCSGGRDCGFAVWKTVAGKRLTENQVRTLLTKKETPYIEGFMSKKGKKFGACLVFDKDYHVSFHFPK